MPRSGLHSLANVVRHRAFIALLDQAAVSIASFATGILLSRTFTGTNREELGLYYLAVTIGILIVEIQNALVCTPLTVTAPTLAKEDLSRFIGSALIHQGWLSGLVTIALAVLALLSPTLGIGSHRGMLLACSVTAGAVGLRNFARFLNFSLHRPHIACIADWTVTLLQVAGILLLAHQHRLSAWLAVVVIGTASLVGALLALGLTRQFIQPHLSRAWGDFRSNWKLSRWVFASGVIGNIGTNIYPWVLDTFSSTLQTAVWGNCNTVSSAGNPVLMGLQNWMAPAIAHAAADRSRERFRTYVIQLAGLFLLILIPMLLTLAWLARPLLHRLYHDQTPGTTELVLLLGVGSLFQSIGFIFTRGLFSLKRGSIDTWTNVIPVVVLLIAGLPLAHAFGAIGGAFSLLIAQILSAIARGAMFWRVCQIGQISAEIQDSKIRDAEIRNMGVPLSPAVAEAM